MSVTSQAWKRLPRSALQHNSRSITSLSSTVRHMVARFQHSSCSGAVAPDCSCAWCRCQWRRDHEGSCRQAGARAFRRPACQWCWLHHYQPVLPGYVPPDRAHDHGQATIHGDEHLWIGDRSSGRGHWHSWVGAFEVKALLPSTLPLVTPVID